MIPLLLTSVVGLAVVIERSFSLRRRRILRPDIINVVGSIEKPEDIENVVNDLGRPNDAFLNIVRVSLQHRGRPREEIKEVIVDQGRQEA